MVGEPGVGETAVVGKQRTRSHTPDEVPSALQGVQIHSESWSYKLELALRW
ncbi:hypothetical protein O9992_00235 [Vibrio lentus]|nr:hypothetical protein [Vibrio lentus]